jgi:mutator family transposase
MPSGMLNLMTLPRRLWLRALSNSPAAGKRIWPNSLRLRNQLRRSRRQPFGSFNGQLLPGQPLEEIWSTNPLERLNKEIKRRTDVVGVFPNPDALARLAGSVLAEAHDEWQVADKRYLSEGSRHDQKSPLTNITVKIIYTTRRDATRRRFRLLREETRNET